MKITKLIDDIDLQPEVSERVVEYYNSSDFEQVCLALDKDEEGQVGSNMKLLNSLLSPDEGQIKKLTYMLHRAIKVYGSYKELGISYDVYIATMRCFTRFVGECFVKTGIYAFDRAWWTGRQVSLKLFRIGELEYEMTTHKEDRVISIHIPSDCDLSPEKCTDSLKLSKEFFSKYFPAYSGSKYICDSWLISPVLKDLLPATSNILAFQSMFDIVDTNPDSISFAEWVFHQNTFEFVPKTNDKGEVELAYQQRNIDFDTMPGNTSLQRKIKEHIKAGHIIGDGFGVLKNYLSSNDMIITSVREHPEYFDRAVDYFSSKWGIDRKIYEDSISECISTSNPLPRWYIMLRDNEIIGSYGLIENDFMVRKDLMPWLCALYIEESARGQSLGSKLLEHGKQEALKLGFEKVYLCTDHIGYYEKYGWHFFGMEESEWGGNTRVYYKAIKP